MGKPIQVLLATGNRHKLREIREMLAGTRFEMISLADLDGEVDKLIAALQKAPLPAVKAVKEFARNAFHNDIRTVNDFARNLHATVNASSRMQAG